MKGLKVDFLPTFMAMSRIMSKMSRHLSFTVWQNCKTSGFLAVSPVYLRTPMYTKKLEKFLPPTQGRARIAIALSDK